MSMPTYPVCQYCGGPAASVDFVHKPDCPTLKYITMNVLESKVDEVSLETNRLLKEILSELHRIYREIETIRLSR